ncbi:unnamed protein product [Nippostrongylus brasiliensis]|uniref:Uncharacterized protein n=1 Tax=Nippostrongylus brasiliensis TaxID=27835 RepID=A0A158R3E7_NIPBR|nr:unnamed protein product [Nippostrongylus brasiliensis]
MERTFCSVQPQFSLHAPTASSPVRHHRPSISGQSMDSAHYRKFLSDRRKSYRNRSLGATIASAPSVEQEDYRTPKPSFDKSGGKSFDCCAPTGSLASDSNGLVKLQHSSFEYFQANYLRRRSNAFARKDLDF